MIAKSEHRILWLPNEERMWDDEGGGSRNAAGVRIDSSNAHSVAAVFSCLRVIAETVASLPLHVLERTPGGGKRIARELPLYRQLHAQPNGWQTSFEWREQAVFHIGLWGDAFSELKAGQIVPLHPSRMKVERVENGKIRYKFREDKGTETIYSNEQILQIRGPSDDGINGMSIVEECKDAIALARACELHGARFFAAGARPGFVLSTDGNLNAEARESLRSQWDRRHGGVGNSHNTAVLTGGLKPYEIPQSSNSDAQFLELRRYQLEEIARLFRCPGHLLGIGAGSPQADIEFVQHTILPWLRRFESAFMRDLIEDDDRYLIEFDVRGLLRGDSSSRSAYYRAMWDIGVLNTDDIRELENMDPVEGGDVRYRPLNMGTLGEMPTEGDVLAQQQPGSGIDGQAVEGGLAAAAGEPVVPAVPGEPAETSLSTAEVSSLLTVVKQITDGMLTVDAARAIIAAAFPVLSAARVETILQGVAVKQEEPPQPTEPAARAFCKTGKGNGIDNSCSSKGGGGGDSSGKGGRTSQGALADAITASPMGIGKNVLLVDLKEKLGVTNDELKKMVLKGVEEGKYSLGGPTYSDKLDPREASTFIQDPPSPNPNGEPFPGAKNTELIIKQEKFDQVKSEAAQHKIDVLAGESPATADTPKTERPKKADKDAVQELIGDGPVNINVENVARLAAIQKKLREDGDDKAAQMLQEFWQQKVKAGQTYDSDNPQGQKPAKKKKRSLPESRALTISMDFDRTFAADPTLWGEFARKAVADGNTVVMISRRPEEDRQTVAETLGDYADAFSQVLLVGGDTMKGDAAQAAGIDVDVWVDDSPQTITPAKPCDECEDKPKSRSRRK